MNRFITPTEIASDLNISRSTAYKLVKRLNDELAAKGYLVIAGRVSRQYYEERTYQHGTKANV